MTKYILHGGRTGIISKSNKNFFAEMVKDLKEPISILCVYFASKKIKWQELFEDDKKHFIKWARLKKSPEFLLAEDNQEKLIKQIKSTDIIYIRGGREPYLNEIFRSIKNIKKLFQGKVIGGSSAGANVLSKQYHSNSKGSIMNGLGILPIKVFVHYDDSKKEKLEKLKSQGEDLKTYTIPEQEYIIV